MLTRSALARSLTSVPLRIFCLAQPKRGGGGTGPNAGGTSRRRAAGPRGSTGIYAAPRARPCWQDLSCVGRKTVSTSMRPQGLVGNWPCVPVKACCQGSRSRHRWQGEARGPDQRRCRRSTWPVSFGAAAWPGLGSVQIAAPPFTSTTSPPRHQQLVGRTSVCWDTPCRNPCGQPRKPISSIGASGQPGRTRSG